MAQHRMICIGLVLLLSHSSRGQDPTKASWYPTKIGTEWTYQTSGATIIQKVVAHEKIGENLCAKIETSVGGKTVASEHIAVKEDGVYRCAVGGNELSEPLLFLKLPPKKGDSWEVEATVQGQKIKGKFNAGEDTISVNNKTYRTVTVESQGLVSAGDQQIAFLFYFSRGVGIVKQVVTVGKTHATLELTKFVEPKKSE